MTIRVNWLVTVVASLTVIGPISVSAVNSKSVETETVAARPSKADSTQEKKKTTEVSFDEVLVQGKYHFSDEAVTTVEEDKVLDALLGVRTDFKDRLKKSSTRF